MADVLADLLSKGIKKRIIYAGKGGLPLFENGSKMTFHYVTKKCDDESTVLDDSRKHKKPMELIVGKQFKIEAWEICLKTMKIGEVAEFIADTRHTAIYPHVAKSLREISCGHNHTHTASHHCGMAAMTAQTVGYADLDEVLKKPQPLSFTFELLDVISRESHSKDVWEMDDSERIAAVPRLKNEGNDLYREGDWTAASDKYATAVGILDQLMLREKPEDGPWLELDQQRLPILANYSQCLLLQKDYYGVIEHTSTILKRDPDNVKALYRRAKAHVGAWNPQEARRDFNRVITLDPSMSNSITKELKNIALSEKQKNEDDRKKFHGKMFAS